MREHSGVLELFYASKIYVVTAWVCTHVNSELYT